RSPAHVRHDAERLAGEGLDALAVHDRCRGAAADADAAITVVRLVGDLVGEEIIIAVRRLLIEGGGDGADLDGYGAFRRGTREFLREALQAAGFIKLLF